MLVQALAAKEARDKGTGGAAAAGTRVSSAVAYLAQIACARARACARTHTHTHTHTLITFGVLVPPPAAYVQPWLGAQLHKM